MKLKYNSTARNKRLASSGPRKNKFSSREKALSKAKFLMKKIAET